jgi:hypothetical protein
LLVPVVLFRGKLSSNVEGFNHVDKLLITHTFLDNLEINGGRVGCVLFGFGIGSRDPRTELVYVVNDRSSLPYIGRPDMA